MEKDIQHQIKRWLQDEEAAFEQIFHYYYPRVYRYAFRYIKNEFWAEELSMEVLSRIWEKKSLITKAETFENYLFTAARNHLLNHWQRKVDGLLSLDSLSTDSAGIADNASSSAYDPVLSKELELMYNIACPGCLLNAARSFCSTAMSISAIKRLPNSSIFLPERWKIISGPR